MVVQGQGSRLNLSYCLFALLAQLVGFQNLLLKSEVIVTTNEYQNSCPFLIVKRKGSDRKGLAIRVGKCYQQISCKQVINHLIINMDFLSIFVFYKRDMMGGYVIPNYAIHCVWCLFYCSIRFQMRIEIASKTRSYRKILRFLRNLHPSNR